MSGFLPCKQVDDIKCGRYILKDSDQMPDLILIATGSEVGLAIDSAAELDKEGVAVCVVSMPSVDFFVVQDKAYQDSVLSPEVTKHVTIEARATAAWYQYVSLEGIVVGMDRFGESAPADELFEFFGFSVDNVVHKAKSIL